MCCPAFVSDCLETLEEIGERQRDFSGTWWEPTLIPCLNDDDRWIEQMVYKDKVNQ